MKPYRADGTPRCQTGRVAGSSTRELSASMRALLYTASLLVFLQGIPLLFRTTRTDRYFSWSITPPLTAAFLGAGYWASCVFELAAARQLLWARARIAVPAVLSFTALTLVATLQHVGRFHLHAVAPIARTATWAWLIIYAVVPVAMTVLLVRQLRAPGEDPPREHRLTVWFRYPLGAQGVGYAAAGAALFVLPSHNSWWPWSLTALTAQAVGAWLLGMGIIALHAIIEDDWFRIEPAMLGWVVIGALQLLALARFGTAVSWHSPGAVLYLTLVITATLTGGYGSWIGRQRRARRQICHGSITTSGR
jgi:hypothetical protein